MSAVAVTGLTKRFARSGPPALDHVAFTVPDGSLTCLLGPSGSGKSTALGCIAGLIAADAGTVTIDGVDQGARPAHQRPATLLMQQAQLFDHLTVAGNVEFGLRVRGIGRAERAARAHELLEIVGLAGFGDRSPVHLSGGEQQRVALARALAVDPQVLLADEPLASLDPEVRRSLQQLLASVQRQLGTTIILVTHDVGEALALADQLVVLAGGTVHASGAPHALLRQPATVTAAQLLGIRNIIRGIRRADVLDTPAGPLSARWTTYDANGDRPVTCAIHPGHVTVVDGPGPNVVNGVITDVRLLGTDIELTATTVCGELVARAQPGAVAVGQPVCLRLPADDLIEVADTSA